MSKQRKGHKLKSRTERTDYMKSVIRRSEPTPTITDTYEEIDSTDSSSIQDVSQETEIIENQKWDLKPESINLTNILKGFGVFIILGLLAWGASEIYSFNREIGEIRNDMKHLSDNLSSISTNIKNDSIRQEERLGKQIEKNSEEIEELKTSPNNQ